MAGLVASHAVIADRPIPFGLSFAAGIPAAFAPSAAVGAFLGYLVSPLENGNFRYIAGVLGVIALRLFASLSEKISKNRLLPAAICLFSSLLTSFFTMRLFDSSVTDIFAEAFFAAGGAYFISGFFREYYENPAGLGNRRRGFAFLLSRNYAYGTSRVCIRRNIGRSHRGAGAYTYGGEIRRRAVGCGMRRRAALSLVFGGAPGDTAVFYAFTGVLAGVFSSFGKYAAMLVPLFFGLAGAAVNMSALQSAVCAVEAILGSALFWRFRGARVYFSESFLPLNRKWRYPAA